MVENANTYGYLDLEQKSFENIIRKANLTLDIPKTGYNFAATNYVCENISQKTDNCGFINTINLLKSENKETAQDLIIDAFIKEKTIVGEIPINPEASQFILLDDIMFIARQTLASDDFDNKMMVAPLSIDSNDKETHGVALCIAMDKAKKHADILILEQHAQRDGGKLDFSKEIDLTLNHLSKVFEQVGISVDTFQNDKSICREKGVCGIVSTAVCEKLLNTDNPLNLAQIGGIKISAEKVKKLHNQNFCSYQIDNPPNIPLLKSQKLSNG